MTAGKSARGFEGIRRKSRVCSTAMQQEIVGKGSYGRSPGPRYLPALPYFFTQGLHGYATY